MVGLLSILLCVLPLDCIVTLNVWVGVGDSVVGDRISGIWGCSEWSGKFDVVFN